MSEFVQGSRDEERDWEANSKASMRAEWLTWERLALGRA